MYAILPPRSKPSKSTSTDKTRAVLQHAELRETADGWELVTCDSYQLARVALETKERPGDETPLIAGPISPDALKAIEKSRAFRANGTVEPCDPWGLATGQTFTRPDVGTFPQWDQLAPEAPAEEFLIGLDAKKLYELSQSLGAEKFIVLRVDLGADKNGQRPHSQRRPIAVGTNAGGFPGLLMPVKFD
jgi:hypothetical protein